MEEDINGLIDALPDVIIPGSEGHSDHHTVLHAATKHFKNLFGQKFGVGEQLPAATSGQRGNLFVLTEGSAADRVYVCVFDGNDYEWKELSLGS